ncbi:MAG: phosphoribosylanthranilate isomerase [bacterium]
MEYQISQEVNQRRVRVKICGITNLDDALCAIRAGVDAIGFIFAESPRRVVPDQVASITLQLPPFVTRVGVFVNQSIEEIRRIYTLCGLDCIQLHGDESPEFCDDLGLEYIKAFRIKDHNSLALIPAYVKGTHRKPAALLLDTYSKNCAGGTGKTFNWDLALEAKKFGTIILSGGLCPKNVRQAIETVHPYAVDTSSGVESSPGKKDTNKINHFMEEVTNVHSA